LSGTTFDANNPGLPISYTIRDVATRQQVRVNLGTEYDVATCQPVVDVKRLLLDLDANNATTAAASASNCNCGCGTASCNCNSPTPQPVVTNWPGSTQTGNSPSSFNNLMVTPKDANGNQWVQLDFDSFAAGMDCGFMTSKSYTVVAVLKPTIPPQDRHWFLTAGSFAGAAAMGGKDSFLQLGWDTATSFMHGHYFDDVSFALAPQAAGHVLVATYDMTSGVAQTFSNGQEASPLATTKLSPLADTSNCMLGASWNEWSVFSKSPYGKNGAVSGNCKTLIGNFGELRGYMGTLSEAERRVVECELGKKWGVGVGGCTNGVPDEHW
jgi:hypothetical protein